MQTAQTVMQVRPQRKVSLPEMRERLVSCDALVIIELKFSSECILIARVPAGPKPLWPCVDPDYMPDRAEGSELDRQQAYLTDLASQVHQARSAVMALSAIPPRLAELEARTQVSPRGNSGGRLSSITTSGPSSALLQTIGSGPKGLASTMREWQNNPDALQRFEDSDLNIIELLFDFRVYREFLPVWPGKRMRSRKRSDCVCRGVPDVRLNNHLVVAADD